MLQVINTIDTAITSLETLYTKMEDWRLENANLDTIDTDKAVVIGHLLGTLYSDYRKGLRYIVLAFIAVQTYINSFVEYCETPTEYLLIAEVFMILNSAAIATAEIPNEVSTDISKIPVLPEPKITTSLTPAEITELSQLGIRQLRPMMPKARNPKTGKPWSKTECLAYLATA